MKKLPLVCVLLAASLSAYAQGTVVFNDNQQDVRIHIYAPQLADPGQQVYGDANASTGVTADIYAYNGIDPNPFGDTPISNGFTGYDFATITTGGSTVYTGGAIGNISAANPTPAGAYHYNN